MIEFIREICKWWANWLIHNEWLVAKNLHEAYHYGGKRETIFQMVFFFFFWCVLNHNRNSNCVIENVGWAWSFGVTFVGWCSKKQVVVWCRNFIFGMRISNVEILKIDYSMLTMSELRWSLQTREAKKKTTATHHSRGRRIIDAQQSTHDLHFDSWFLKTRILP